MFWEAAPGHPQTCTSPFWGWGADDPSPPAHPDPAAQEPHCAFQDALYASVCLLVHPGSPCVHLRTHHTPLGAFQCTPGVFICLLVQPRSLCMPFSLPQSPPWVFGCHPALPICHSVTPAALACHSVPSRPLGLAFSASKCHPFGFMCPERHWLDFWCASELSVCLLVHLKISVCFWGTPEPPWDFQKAPDPSVCCQDRAGCTMFLLLFFLVFVGFFP